MRCKMTGMIGKRSLEIGHVSEGDRVNWSISRIASGTVSSRRYFLIPIPTSTFSGKWNAEFGHGKLSHHEHQIHSLSQIE